MANIIIGKVACTFKKEYSSTATYNRLDVVSYNGSSYGCLMDNTKNILPTDTSRWVLMAKKGDKGDAAFNFTEGTKTYKDF